MRIGIVARTRPLAHEAGVVGLGERPQRLFEIAAQNQVVVLDEIDVVDRRVLADIGVEHGLKRLVDGLLEMRPA